MWNTNLDKFIVNGNTFAYSVYQEIDINLFQTNAGRDSDSRLLNLKRMIDEDLL